MKTDREIELENEVKVLCRKLAEQRGYSAMRDYEQPNITHEELNTLLAKAREECRKEAVPEDVIDAVSKAMRQSFQLGQLYWQQADSDSFSQNKKADATQLTFDSLVDEIRTMLASAPKPEAKGVMYAGFPPINSAPKPEVKP